MHILDEFKGYTIFDGFKLAYDQLKIKADIAVSACHFAEYSDYAQDWARLSSFVSGYMTSYLDNDVDFSWSFSWNYYHYGNGMDPYYANPESRIRSTSNFTVPPVRTSDESCIWCDSPIFNAKQTECDFSLKVRCDEIFSR